MQDEGPADDDVPLVALHDPGAGETGFRYLPMPRAEQTALRQYFGSAAIDRTGHYLAVSSPRGNRVLVCYLAAFAMPMVASVPLCAVCGLGASGEACGLVQSGRAHVRTTVSHSPRVCRLLLANIQ